MSKDNYSSLNDCKNTTKQYFNSNLFNNNCNCTEYGMKKALEFLLNNNIQSYNWDVYFGNISYSVLPYDENSEFPDTPDYIGPPSAQLSGNNLHFLAENLHMSLGVTFNTSTPLCNLVAIEFWINGNVENFKTNLSKNYPQINNCSSYCCCNQNIISLSNEGTYLFDTNILVDAFQPSAGPLFTYGKVVAYDCDFIWIQEYSVPDPMDPSSWYPTSKFLLIALADVICVCSNMSLKK